jgi:predicted  nucleic acid-binding Zn-ribbon protein
MVGCQERIDFMKILNLTLRNFKGINNFELNTNGQDVNAFGDNATGKTTLADAFMWLLFGKDSQNRSDFEIKTLGPDGEPEHGLEHMVEAILELEDGSHLSLKKVYMEKWTKKRGSAMAEFTGHTTDHYIDGVPVQKKEYDARIAEIADESIFRLLTDPRYFNEVLHWQKRRELLLEVCGDVSDAEVIAIKKDLAKLGDILGNRTIEQHRKVVQARRSEINKELEKIPVRIDEVTRNLPDVSDIANESELPNDIAKLREQLQAKQEELAQAKAGGQVAEKTKELRTLESRLIELQNEHRRQIDEKVVGKRALLSAVQSNINRLSTDVESMSRKCDIITAEIKALEVRMDSLRKKWHEVNNQEFEFEHETVCPTCGQTLPTDSLEAARLKALEDFNRSKAEKLETINADGQRLKQAKVAAEQSLTTAMHEAEKARRELAESEQKEASIKLEIDSIMQGSESVESTKEYATVQERIMKIREDIANMQADSNTAIMAIQKEIDTLTDAITVLEQAAARLEARKNGEKRIEELKADERRLAAEFEDIEQQLYLTEEFIRAKVQLLEGKINSKFRMARFKLFDVQVNGAISETCETTFNGVPYSNLNNGARLNIGLDIINTLSEHFGFAPPVWLDNAESVTDILPTKGQQIRLIVSEKDKKLRIELAERESFKEVV